MYKDAIMLKWYRYVYDTDCWAIGILIKIEDKKFYFINEYGLYIISLKRLEYMEPLTENELSPANNTLYADVYQRFYDKVIGDNDEIC